MARYVVNDFLLIKRKSGLVQLVFYPKKAGLKQFPEKIKKSFLAPLKLKNDICSGPILEKIEKRQLACILFAEIYGILRWTNYTRSYIASILANTCKIQCIQNSNVLNIAKHQPWHKQKVTSYKKSEKYSWNPSTKDYLERKREAAWRWETAWVKRKSPYFEQNFDFVQNMGIPVLLLRPFYWEVFYFPKTLPLNGNTPATGFCVKGIW